MSYSHVCAPPAKAESLAHTPACTKPAIIAGPNALAQQTYVDAAAHGIECWRVGRAGDSARSPGITVAGMRADTDPHGYALRFGALAMIQRRCAENGFSQ